VGNTREYAALSACAIASVSPEHPSSGQPTFITSDDAVNFPLQLRHLCLTKRADTVGELESAKNYAAHMATLESKSLEKPLLNIGLATLK
jgi:hypothetical protein